MLRTDATFSYVSSALDLPSTTGVVVHGIPDQVGTFDFTWERVPVQYLARTDAFFIDAQSVSGDPVLVPWFAIANLYLSLPAGLTDSVTVTSRGVYRAAVGPLLGESGLGETAIGFGRPSGDLRVFSLWAEGVGQLGVAPLRQAGRTDGLIGAPRQGRAALASQIRQGRSLVR